MKKLVLDSCVFIKLFFEENDRNQAVDFMSKIVEDNKIVFVPDLFIYEVYSICCRKFSDHEIASYLHDYRYNLHYFSLTPNLISQAIKITNYGESKSGYPSFYDSVYHTKAIQENCTFITADEKHFDKTAKKFGHIKLLKNV